jgi:hypothetical protein
MAAALRCRRRPAMASRVGWAVAQSRRRNSGRRSAICLRRNPRRTCIHSCRCGPPSNWEEDPCRNIRSLAEVAAPRSLLPAWLAELSQIEQRCEWQISLDSGQANLEPDRFGWNQNRAPGFYFDAFSSREPTATSLENAITPSAAAWRFPSADRARSRSAHGPRSGAASAHC